MATAPIVRLDAAAVRFGGLVVLAGITASVEAGQVIAVRGRNGAGKTTLLRLVAGVIAPTGGRRRGPLRAAFVPSALEPPALSARRWLKGVREHRADPFALLDRLGFDGDLQRSCRALSLGNLRKLLLADAFTSGQPLVVVDEASSGLDDIGVDGLRTLAREHARRGVAVVLADQEGRSIEPADLCWRLARGHIVVEREQVASEQRVELRGPTSRLDALMAAARSLGFERTDDHG